MFLCVLEQNFTVKLFKQRGRTGQSFLILWTVVLKKENGWQKYVFR